MMRKFGFILFAVVLFTSACGGAAPTPTASAPPPTLGPTVTLPPPPLDPSPTQLERQDLPAEWTLTPSVTPLVTTTPMPGTAAPTPDSTNAALLRAPVSAACANFQINYEETAVSFSRTSNPRVTWTAVPDALGYRVSLFNDRQELIVTTIIGETTIDFDRSAFVFEQRYFWEVRPINREGNQICASAGNLLFPID